MLRHSRDPYNRYHMDYFTKGASAIKKTTEIKIENNLEKPEIIENNTNDFSIGVPNNFSDYIRKLLITKKLYRCPDKRYIPVVCYKLQPISENSYFAKSKNSEVISNDSDVYNGDIPAIKGIDPVVCEVAESMTVFEYSTVLLKKCFTVGIPKGSTVNVVGFMILPMMYYNFQKNTTFIDHLNSEPLYYKCAKSEELLPIYDFTDDRVEKYNFYSPKGLYDYIIEIGMLFLAFSKKYKTNVFSNSFSNFLNSIGDNTVSVLKTLGTDYFDNIGKQRQFDAITDTRGISAASNTFKLPMITKNSVNLINKNNRAIDHFYYEDNSTKYLIPNGIFMNNDKKYVELFDKYVSLGYLPYNYLTTSKIPQSVENSFVFSCAMRNQYDFGTLYNKYRDNLTPETITVITQKIKDGQKRYLKTFGTDKSIVDNVIIEQVPKQHEMDLYYLTVDNPVEYLKSNNIELHEDNWFYNKKTQKRVICIHKYNEYLNLIQPENIFVETKTGNICRICGEVIIDSFEESWRATEELTPENISTYYTLFDNVPGYKEVTDSFDSFFNEFKEYIPEVNTSVFSGARMTIDTDSELYKRLEKMSPEDSFIKKQVNSQVNKYYKELRSKKLAKVKESEYNAISDKINKEFEKIKPKIIKKSTESILKLLGPEKIKTMKSNWLNNMYKNTIKTITYIVVLYTINVISGIVRNDLEIFRIVFNNNTLDDNEVSMYFNEIYNKLNEKTGNNIKFIDTYSYNFNLAGESEYTNNLMKALKIAEENSDSLNNVESILSYFAKYTESNKTIDYDLSGIYRLIGRIPERDIDCFQGHVSQLPFDKVAELRDTFFVNKVNEIDNCKKHVDVMTTKGLVIALESLLIEEKEIKDARKLEELTTYDYQDPINRVIDRPGINYIDIGEVNEHTDLIDLKIDLNELPELSDTSVKLWEPSEIVNKNNNKEHKIDTECFRNKIVKLLIYLHPRKCYAFDPELIGNINNVLKSRNFNNSVKVNNQEYTLLLKSLINAMHIEAHKLNNNHTVINNNSDNFENVLDSLEKEIRINSEPLSFYEETILNPLRKMADNYLPEEAIDYNNLSEKAKKLIKHELDFYQSVEENVNANTFEGEEEYEYIDPNTYQDDEEN